MKRSQVDEARAVFEQLFKIAAETAIRREPSKGALNHPAHGDKDKAPAASWSKGNLPDNTVLILNPAGEVLTVVAAISQDFLQALPERFRQLLKQQFRTVSFGDMGGMNDHREQVAHRIDQDRAFASVDFLGTIKALFAADLRGAHTSFCR